MTKDLINISKLNESSPDSLSRFLSSVIISLAGIKRFNQMFKFSVEEVNNPSIFSDILKRSSINLKSSDFSIPENGPFIVCVPVFSGILELISTFSAIYNELHRPDVRFVVFNADIASLEPFSNFFLDVKSFHTSSVFKSALNYLESGGALICFNKVTVDTTHFSNLFSLPLKLSKYSKSPLFALFVDSDAPSSLFSLLSFNKWFYNLFTLRRFISCSNSNVIIHSSKQIFTASDLTDFYDSILDMDNIATLFKKLVPRGTVTN